ncbi:zinc finger and SCAN domain-containing protein 31-like [Sitodiplosis mosellana]|uniref:zinc finger and SCAN domain-containing protein 31-like n=1 Tax=Sitodiplosis mosellana TaxID=263140 RepID=UPI002444E96D|nr:zinc finger and SCAN domain-containing protein 31-like [Sitodiplosis mosellana]
MERNENPRNASKNKNGSDVLASGTESFSQKHGLQSIESRTHSQSVKNSHIKDRRVAGSDTSLENSGVFDDGNERTNAESPIIPSMEAQSPKIQSKETQLPKITSKEVQLIGIRKTKSKKIQLKRIRKNVSCESVKISSLPSTSEENCEIKIEKEIIEIGFNSMEHAVAADPLRSHCKNSESMDHEVLNGDETIDEEIIEDILVKEEPRLHFDNEHPLETTDQSSISSGAEDSVEICEFEPDTEAPDFLFDEPNHQAIDERQTGENFNDERSIKDHPNGGILTKSTNRATRERIHQHERSYYCNFCGDRFVNQLQCNNHEKSCSGEEFKCFFCPMKFRLVYLRDQHHKDHTNGGAHVCKTCLKSFIRKSSLIHHQRIHTGEDFECNICFKRFPEKHHLSYHSKFHLNGKQYECDKCDKVYKRYSCFIRHRTHGHSKKNSSKKTKAKIPFLYQPKII